MERDLLTTMLEWIRGHYFGKYRGIVTDNADPEKRGRLKLRVPTVLDDAEIWALPCVPYAGDKVGFFFLPEAGTAVWVEFEGGDPSYPIWTGCWWGSAIEMPKLLDPPPPAGTEPKTVITTKAGHSILLDDSPSGAGITLETPGGQKIVINAQGIEITNGQGASIKLTARKVAINGTALEVE